MFNRGFDGVNHCLWFAGRYFYSGWGLLLLAVSLLAAGILIYLLMKNIKKNDTAKDALEKLKTRYVMGDLTDEEYLQKKRVLES